MKLHSIYQTRIRIYGSLGWRWPVSPAFARPPRRAPRPRRRAEAPPIVEWVYQVKWGYFDDFYTIFKKYQIPILDEEKKEGLVTKYIVQKGGGHVGESERWDLRVLIYYKDKDAQTKARGVGAKLFPDRETVRKDELERWRLTTAHWDRPLTEMDPHRARNAAGRVGAPAQYQTVPRNFRGYTLKRRTFLWSAGAAVPALAAMSGPHSFGEEPKTPGAIALPKPKIQGGKPLLDALSERKTLRNFGPAPLPPQTLSNLLWAAFGVNRPDGKRTAPSAMNIQDIDIYVFLPEGVYVYDAAAHILKPVLAGDQRAKSARQPPPPAPGAVPRPSASGPANVPVTLVYIADQDKAKAAGRRVPDPVGADGVVERARWFHRPERISVCGVGGAGQFVPCECRPRRSFRSVEPAPGAEATLQPSGRLPVRHELTPMPNGEPGNPTLPRSKQMKHTTSRLLTTAVIALAPAAWAESVAGLWNATTTVNGTEIPFKIEFSGDGANVKGWFFNGEEHESSTSGTYQNGALVLNFDTYLSVLKATVKNARLDGEYVSRRGDPLPIHAVRAASQPASKVEAPDISGLWYLEGVTSRKHDEKAFQFVVQQQAAEVSTAILRIDGDGGTLTGSYRDGKFVLSHFSGARPSLVVLTPQADGTLAVDQLGKSFTAVRPDTGARQRPRPSSRCEPAYGRQGPHQAIYI